MNIIILLEQNKYDNDRKLVIYYIENNEVYILNLVVILSLYQTLKLL